MQERTVVVSKADLTAALKDWDTEAKAANWEERSDETRFGDTADYLLDKVEARVARRHAD